MKCFACALAVAAVVDACQRELEHVDRFHGLSERLVKRQEATAFPPELDENESVLIGSFEATDIDTWSYYYTHGLHIAGTNESQAQWTADRWSENGFTAGLVPYGKSSTNDLYPSAFS